MEMYPGPYCQAIGVSIEHLNQRNLPQDVNITNGLVLELHSYIIKENLSTAALVKILSSLDKNYSGINYPSSVLIKIKRLIEQRKKLGHKKKVKGVKNVKELLDQTFQAPIPTKVCMPPEPTSTAEINTQNFESEQRVPEIHVAVHTNQDRKTNSVHCQTEESEYEQHGSPIKNFNLLKYKHSQLVRQNKILTRKLDAKRSVLEKVDFNVGHYAVRNVNKRDETSKKNLHHLRNEQRANISLRKVVRQNSENIATYKMQLKELNNEIENLKKDILTIEEQASVAAEKIQVEKDKKVMSQKANSYLRQEIQALKETVSSQCLHSEHDHEACNTEIVKLKLKLEEKQMAIDTAQNEIDESTRNDQMNITTRNEDGSFTDNVRLCIMELAGLEVATEKVSSVIKCISKHLFEKDFSKENLPSSSTVQSIVDEGHFIVKTFIAEKMQNSENWGLGRDGTSRKKQKIIDTSITLDSGDVMSLGFSQVANETAATIQQITQNQLNELAKLNSYRGTDEHEFIAESLKKLSFTMSDRASNEKLADKLLDEWRSEMLENFDDDNLTVHHFHCMAHVLLGFHNYMSPELKTLESELVDTKGPIGREALPVFRSWSKRENFVVRTARTTSDVFGPAGEHHGVRDRWEAYCSVNGIKSEIGNYRDNRFNAIFQTSAEVFLHRQDFLNVLETVEKPNLKLQSVKSDLRSLEICALLQCLGLFYIKVTGPYWKLVTNGKVPYFDLHKHVQDIHMFLEQCVTSPEILFETDCHWTETDPLELRIDHQTRHLSDCLFELNENTRELLLKAIPVVAGAMLKTVNKQLVDFLPGGIYCDNVSESDVKRTHFAPVTNLSCEHHFGDLDSSQRRRPNSSLHHHSSIQLLKRNRKPVIKWVDEMDCSEKSSLFLNARQGGRELRKTHLQNEKDVLSKINERMVSESERGIKRKNKSKTESGNKLRKQRKTSEAVENEHSEIVTLTLGECIIVAYQDNWYPGYVEKLLDGPTAVVKFMAPCRKSGYFQWPSRDDKQVVNIQFVLAQNIVPDCLNSGRQWFIKEHEHLDKMYGQFSSDNFV